MYVLVRPSGALSFQLDYRVNGRRETVTFGKCGPAGLSLARARELWFDAKRAIAARYPGSRPERTKTLCSANRLASPPWGGSA
jgi:hypothetical protein